MKPFRAAWRWVSSFLDSDTRLFGVVVALACLVSAIVVALDLMVTRSLCLSGIVKFC